MRRWLAIPMLALFGSLFGNAPNAHAEAIYRCQGADGAVAYQQSPCPGGKPDESTIDVRAQPMMGTGDISKNLAVPDTASPYDAYPGYEPNKRYQRMQTEHDLYNERMDGRKSCKYEDGTVVDIRADETCMPREDPAFAEAERQRAARERAEAAEQQRKKELECHNKGVALLAKERSSISWDEKKRLREAYKAECQ